MTGGVDWPRTERAPAKVNLALDILGRREDGYHALRMVMQSVSLRDDVTVQEAETGFLLRAGFSPAGTKSLEQQAAAAFFAELGRPAPGLEVLVEKRIPAYAGLGGGSADVAALLRVLRSAYAPEMSPETLERIGLSVGSDVPFCLRRGTCLAEGRGERLRELPTLPECWMVLCKPDFDIPTPRMFALADAISFTRRPDFGGMAEALRQGSLEAVASRLCNVFEEVLPPEQRREVEHIKASMVAQGALNAAMSGSGPTVFGLFRDRTAAEGAVLLFKADYAQTFLAEPVEV